MQDHTPNLAHPQLPLEEWRDIPDYEGYYQASNLGHIRSLDRFQAFTDRGTDCVRFHKGKILHSYQEKNGYLRVHLRSGNMPRRWGVHQLIALTFLPHPSFDKAQINHKNGIRVDNHISNLEWVTPKENAYHSSEILDNHKRGTRNHNCKLTEDQVRLIRKERPTSSLHKMAKQYNVSIYVIYAICCRKTWTWLD